MTEAKSIKEYLSGNAYPGRGIVCGLSPNAEYWVNAYFIMGRSENSRNRIFEKEEDVLYTKPFAPEKVEDPSLILYPAVEPFEQKLAISNGDHTRNIVRGLSNGESFQESLSSRIFEPDAPNFTPRISALMHFEEALSCYEMSILRAVDAKGSLCQRSFFYYPAKAGLGHLLHTYENDGNPIPSFQGEPRAIQLRDSIDDFGQELWESLDEQNKISLYLRYTKRESLEIEERILNKREEENK